MARRKSNRGRPFNFKQNGHGIVTREARVDYKHWSSVIQILEFTDQSHKGYINLRFGYCNKTGKLIARPLYLTENELAALGKKATKEPEIRKMLKSFCDQIR